MHIADGKIAIQKSDGYFGKYFQRSGSIPGIFL